MVRLSAVLALATVALACFAAADASSRHLLQSRESLLLPHLQSLYHELAILRRKLMLGHRLQ